MLERNSDDFFEYVAVAVPADAGARIVAGEENMDEVVRLQSGKRGGAARGPACSQSGMGSAGIKLASSKS